MYFLNPTVRKGKSTTSTVNGERNLFDVSKITGFGKTGAAIKGEQNLSFDIGETGVSYDYGVKITSYVGQVDCELAKGYNELSVTLLPVSGDLSFVILDKDTGKEIVNKTLKKGEICELNGIDIKGVENLRFKCGDTKANFEMYFLNPTVK